MKHYMQERRRKDRAKAGTLPSLDAALNRVLQSRLN